MQNPHIATEISSGYTYLIISKTAKSLKLKTQLATWLGWYGNVWMISLPSVQGALTRIWEDIPVQQVGLGLISWANRLDYHSGWDVSLVLLKKPDNTAETQTSSGYSSHVLSNVECRAARVMSFIIRLSSARRQDLFLSEINISFAPVACNRVSGDG